MPWKDSFKEGKELVLSTCSEKGPHANIAISLGFADDFLLVADCQMDTTVKNIRENGKICAVGGYFRLKGSADLQKKGKYFDLCAKKTKGYKVKNAIVIKVDEVFDLNEIKKIV